MDTDSTLMELPFQLLVFSFKQLLKQNDGIENYERLLNKRNWKLINSLFDARDKKSLCLMNTRLWLKVTINMLQDVFPWTTTIYNYQMNVIRQ